MDGSAVAAGAFLPPGGWASPSDPAALPDLVPKPSFQNTSWCHWFLRSCWRIIQQYSCVRGILSCGNLRSSYCRGKKFKKLTKSSSSHLHGKINTFSLIGHECCLACQQTCRYHYTFLIKASTPLSHCPKFKFRLWILRWLGLTKECVGSLVFQRCYSSPCA